MQGANFSKSLKVAHDKRVQMMKSNANQLYTRVHFIRRLHLHSSHHNLVF